MTNSEKIIEYIQKGSWVDIRFKSIVDTDERNTVIGISMFSEIIFGDGQVIPPHVIDTLQILQVEPIPSPCKPYEVGEIAILWSLPISDHKDYLEAIEENLLYEKVVIKKVLYTPTGLGYEVYNYNGGYGGTVPHHCLAPYFED
jgi:hypothetical protein